MQPSCENFVSRGGRIRMKKNANANATLNREVFQTSRTLEFFTEKELQLQIGFSRDWWPIALVKELIDNALDACETAGILPEIEITVDQDFVSVRDNGPGIPESVIAQTLDYGYRVSDKNHYVSPTRGQLGNALKCVWAMPFVLNGEYGRVDICSNGRAHRIEVSIDRIAQEPLIAHTVKNDKFVKNGTFIKIHVPQIACLLENKKEGYFYKRTNILDLVSG